MVEYGPLKYRNAHKELRRRIRKNSQYQSCLYNKQLENKHLLRKMRDINNKDYITTIERRDLTKSQNIYEFNLSYCRFLERKIERTK